MHIGLCSPHWPPSKGANGIVSYVAEVRGHFLSRGHDVSIVAQGQLIDSNDKVTSLAQKGGAARAFGRLGQRIAWRFDRSSGALAPLGRTLAREVATAHRIRPFDVFEMEESFGWSAMVGSAIDAPVITRLHGPHAVKPTRILTEAEEQRDHARCLAEARAIRSAPMVTSPTWAILQESCAKSGRVIGDGQAAGRSLVIANPIRIETSTPRWSAATCELDHILAIGRFDFWKGGDTMLLAFERLLARRPNARLTMVGPDEGLETAPGVRIGFEAFAQAHLSPRARERVTFTGRLTASQITPLRLKATVTVCASRWESFPYALIEGMAAGCPLVSTAWPAAGEVIVDGQSGLLTPVADAEALAATLERILSDPDRAAMMGAAARQRCAGMFATEVVGDQLLECYETAMGARVLQ